MKLHKEKQLQIKSSASSAKGANKTSLDKTDANSAGRSQETHKQNIVSNKTDSVMYRWRWVMLPLVLMMGFLQISVCYAEVQCELVPVYRAFKDKTLDERKVLQQELKSIGYTLTIDGLLGKVTAAALSRFCEDLAVDDYKDLPAVVATELPKYAAIARNNPDWRGVVANPDFERWLGQQTTQRQSHFKVIQAAGDVLPITILADYRPAAEALSPPSPPQTAPQDDSAVYYRLSAEDFTELQGRGAILQQLETLKNVQYSNEVTLKAAVKASLTELTKLASDYADIAFKTAQQSVSYRLTDLSFDRLRMANIPEGALTPLQEIKSLPFPSLAKLANAVAFRLQQQVKPSASSAPQDQSAAKDQPDTVGQAKSEEPAKSIEPAVIDYAQYSKKITAQADQIMGYELTDASFTKLSTMPDLQVIPAALLDMIGKLQDVEYIDRQQFIRAIDGTVKIQSRHYRDEIVKVAGDTFPLSDISLENLKAKGVPDYILDALTPLKGQQYTDKRKLKKDVYVKLVQLTEKQKFQDFYPVLAQQARQVAPETLDAFRWSGSSCGCSRDLSGVVYGFYPFWLADQVEAPEGADPASAEQDLDFSALTRIGYYGIYLDDKGEIAQSRHWSNGKNGAEFAKTAAKYRTYLDLVVYTNAWHIWTEAEMSKAAKKVADKMNLKLPLGNADRLKSLLPFVDEARETLGDGVTLYFDDYTNPDKADDRKKIASFMEKLHKELQANPKPLSLNIMVNVDWNELGEEGSLFKQLSETSELLGIQKKQSEQPELLGTQENDKGIIDLILVLLEEPTTDTKKRLRSKIENEFKGEDRRTMLRKIIPIISPTFHDTEPKNKYAQFTDDLIYFQDNFHGVGLWPLPLAQNSDMKEVNDRIIKHFKLTEDQDFMEHMVAQYIPQLCNYACPNRWQFRIAFDILAFLLVLVGLVSFSDCRVSERIKENPWPVLALLAVLLLVFGTLLVCDPFWNQKSDDVAFGLLGAILIFGIVYYIRKIKQGKLP